MIAPALAGRPLTVRERQVLDCMARGLTNREIGAELYLSEDTIKTHARRMFKKLGAASRIDAVRKGFRMVGVRCPVCERENDVTRPVLARPAMETFTVERYIGDRWQTAARPSDDLPAAIAVLLRVLHLYGLEHQDVRIVRELRSFTVETP